MTLKNDDKNNDSYCDFKLVFIQYNLFDFSWSTSLKTNLVIMYCTYWNTNCSLTQLLLCVYECCFNVKFSVCFSFFRPHLYRTFHQPVQSAIVDELGLFIRVGLGCFPHHANCRPHHDLHGVFLKMGLFWIVQYSLYFILNPFVAWTYYRLD